MYMDDILLYAEDEKQALHLIDTTLTRLSELGFKINPEKSFLGKLEINYLGFKINSSGWTPQNSKVLAITDMKRPESNKDCRSFTGMLQFFSQSIPNLSRILAPINALTGKKKFTWSSEHEESFKMAKDALRNAVKLSFPSMSPEDKYVITSDASNTDWGGGMSQVQLHGNAEIPL